jgi:hypothetical protein
MANDSVFPPAPAVFMFAQGKDEFKALLSRYQMLPFQFALSIFNFYALSAIALVSCILCWKH